MQFVAMSQEQNDDRDKLHWGQAMSVLISGGGMPMGQVIGATTRKGEIPKTQLVAPTDLLATWYR